MTRKLFLAALVLIVARLAAQEVRHCKNFLVISHVTLIDATGAPAKPDQTVVIKGNRIAEVNPTGSSRALESAQLVDGSGLYLIPGLWDMHVHIWDAGLAFPLF